MITLCYCQGLLYLMVRETLVGSATYDTFLSRISSVLARCLLLVAGITVGGGSRFLFLRK